MTRSIHNLLNIGDAVPITSPVIWTAMQSDCVEGLREQVQMKVDATFQYLSMAAYFSRDDVNMLGISSVFFAYSNENRRATKGLIRYLAMRSTADNWFPSILIPVGCYLLPRFYFSDIETYPVNEFMPYHR